MRKVNFLFRRVDYYKGFVHVCVDVIDILEDWCGVGVVVMLLLLHSK